MKEYHPPLLRGVGTLILLFTAVLTLKMTSDAAETATSSTRAQLTFDVSRPLAALSEQEKRERNYQLVINSISENLEELHYDLRKRSIIGTVTGSSLLAFLSVAGSMVITASFFVESYIKRTNQADKTSPETPELTPQLEHPVAIPRPAETN